MQRNEVASYDTEMKSRLMTPERHTLMRNSQSMHAAELEPYRVRSVTLIVTRAAV